MAFCRWSSLQKACDLYLYADAGGGYTCHVASTKGGSHDGRSFYQYDRDEMVDILKMLKAAGYTMPDWLIDEIANEPDEAK